MQYVYRSARGTFRVYPIVGLSGGIRRFDVVMIVQGGQDIQLGTLHKNPAGELSHFPSAFPDADILLQHVMGLIS
jgi:hypothetical protein